jgi:hypothetical protein
LPVSMASWAPACGSRDPWVTHDQPPQDREWGLRCTHLKDPDGNVWELHTPIRASEAAE